jgi:hypothetical protein
MALVDHRHPNGTIYVYEQKSVWDKDKRRSYNKQVCISKRDPETKEILYNERFSTQEALRTTSERDVSVMSMSIGQSLVLDDAASRAGITQVLSLVFGQPNVDRLISLAYAVVASSGEMYHAAAWMESHACSCGDQPMDPSAITHRHERSGGVLDMEEVAEA